MSFERLVIDFFYFLEILDIATLHRVSPRTSRYFIIYHRSTLDGSLYFSIMSVPFPRFLVFLPALQISSGSFGFMKLLLRGNVVSYNGTLIILNRSTSTFRLNERSRTRVYPPEKRGRERMRESNVTKRKTTKLPKRNIVFVEYLVDCTDASLLIDVYFVLRVTNGHFTVY